ncbi:MAG: hypothetical protein AAF078_01795, partial [Planctomycetota bacterium]
MIVGAAVDERAGVAGASGSRSVIVAVGGEAAAAAVRAGLNGLSDRVEVVPTVNYLSALAVVAARREVAAVLGPLDGPTKLMPKLVRSMRELSPGVRLYVRLPSGRESDGAAALSAGFDGYVLEPLTAEELATVVALPREGSTDAGRGAAVEARSGSSVVVGEGELGDVDLVEAVL